MSKKPFDGDEARRRSSVGAEEARQTSELAATRAAGELAMNAEQRAAKVRETADAKIIEFQEKISAAATRAERNATMTYSVRISASRKSPQEVAEIELFAEAVTDIVYDEFLNRGFEVTVDAEEVRDFRDNVDARPEYFATHFNASW